MADRFLPMRAVLAITSYSRTHVYRLIAAGLFPASVPLGPHRVAWVESEVQAWVDARIAERVGP